MLDQVRLESADGSFAAALPEEEELRALWRTFAEEEALAILHDLGLILRSSSSSYSRAVLCWLIQRVAFEEVRAPVAPTPQTSCPC